MDAAASLTKKVGGMPLWVWIVAGGVLASAAVVMQRKKAAANAAPTYVTDTGDSTSVGNGPIGSWALAVSGAGAGKVYGTAEEWGRAAITMLISKGYPINASQSAISRYLASMPLTAQETALRDAALKELGPPPTLPLPQDTRDPEVGLNPPLVTPTPVGPTIMEYFGGPQSTGIYEYDPVLNTRRWLSPGQWAGIRATKPGVNVVQLDPNAPEWDQSRLVGTSGEAPRW
jgi:hypothetical protein